jgi:hypothetical protein
MAGLRNVLWSCMTRQAGLQNIRVTDVRCGTELNLRPLLLREAIHLLICADHVITSGRRATKGGTGCRGLAIKIEFCDCS